MKSTTSRKYFLCLENGSIFGRHFIMLLIFTVHKVHTNIQDILQFLISLVFHSKLNNLILYAVQILFIYRVKEASQKY